MFVLTDIKFNDAYRRVSGRLIFQFESFSRLEKIDDERNNQVIYLAHATKGQKSLSAPQSRLNEVL